MLLNAPVFIRFMFQLQNFSQKKLVNLQSTQTITRIGNNAYGQKDLFYTLLKIVKMAFEVSQNNDGVAFLLQSLRREYQALYSHMNNSTQLDAGDFHIHLMNVVKLVADEMNQTEAYSKAFEIISSVSIDGNEPKVKKYHNIQVSSQEPDLSHCINKKYTGTVVKNEDGHIVKQIYKPLPQQLLAVAEKVPNGDTSFYYPYPTKIETDRNQRYLFTSGIMHHPLSVNCGYFSIALRRQDCVYIFVGSRLKDRFHIDYLPNYFKAVEYSTFLRLEILFSLYRSTDRFFYILKSIHLINTPAHLKILYVKYMLVNRTITLHTVKK